MRLKMRSNTREGEDGQQPITVVLTTKADARMNCLHTALTYIAILAFG